MADGGGKGFTEQAMKEAQGASINRAMDQGTHIARIGLTGVLHKLDGEIEAGAVQLKQGGLNAVAAGAGGQADDKSRDIVTRPPGERIGDTIAARMGGARSLFGGSYRSAALLGCSPTTT